MTISVPTSLALVSTDVLDNKESYNSSIHQNYPIGSKLQQNGKLYERFGTDLVVPAYDSGATYSEGDITYKDGFVKRLGGSDLTVPKQPENYTAYDTDLNSANWSKRYLKIYTGTGLTVPALEFSTQYTHPTYGTVTISIDGNGKVCQSSSKGTFCIEGTILEYNELSATTTETIADVDSEDDTYIPTTFILRGNDVYIRTNVQASIEYTTLAEPAWSIVASASEIMTEVGVTNPNKPFDSSNYTKAKRNTSMRYTVKGLGKFDTLALGHVKADTASIEFKNSLGQSITLIETTIDSSRDDSGNLEDWHTTAIYYSDSVLEADSTVEIILTGVEVELGNILLGMSVHAGFTNLSMKHSYKDFSVLDTDAFGVQDFTERAKVNRFSGSVDIDTVKYDKTVRLLTSLGQNLVIVNGSDKKNVAPNGVSVFSATQMIGRFDSFEQRTELEDDEIKETSTYRYSFTEIV